MPFPLPVAVKFDCYTWACRELLRRWPDVGRQANSRAGAAACRERFDRALHEVFQWSSAADKRAVATQLAGRLRQDATLLRGTNDGLAELLADLGGAVEAIDPAWDGAADLERFHAQGRALARRLFADSPWPATRERLDLVGQLVLDYGRPGAAPAAYRPADGGALLVRFDFGHDFDHYLAYPYWFLHEYSAHVFASDNGRNERFNDGWMLHVAHVFLRRQWVRGTAPGPLDRAQVDVFEDRFYAALRPDPREGCRLARGLDAWLAEDAPGRFMALTYELAAFAFDRPGEERWPTRFLHALAHALDADPAGLRAAVAATTTARELMARLAAP